ncbi:hypothetical protein D3C86_1262110 [compost metagenome]
MDVLRTLQYVDLRALRQAVQLLVGGDQVTAIELVIARHIQQWNRAGSGPLDGLGRPGDVPGEHDDIGIHSGKRDRVDGQVHVGQQGDAHGSTPAWLGGLVNQVTRCEPVATSLLPQF